MPFLHIPDRMILLSYAIALHFDPYTCGFVWQVRSEDPRRPWGL